MIMIQKYYNNNNKNFKKIQMKLKKNQLNKKMPILIKITKLKN